MTQVKDLTGIQKSAAVLVQLGTELAARVLRSMSETEAVALTLEIAKLPSLEKETIAELMEEFVESVIAVKTVGQGGMDAARSILSARLGKNEADEVLAQFSGRSIENPLSFLSHVESFQLASFLQGEHPQAVALILSHVSSTMAAEVMGAMPDEMRADVTRRIALLNRVDPSIVEQTAVILQRKLAGLTKTGPVAMHSGLNSVVEILNNIDQTTERRILSDLDAVDPELADRIREQMFVFEDVLALDDRTLQRVLRQVSPKDLAVALKGVPPSSVAKVMRNISERAALDLEEEIEILGPVRLSTVEAAQATIVRSVRELEASGEIMLIRSDEELVD
ncbi:flagellar motor switch protein FliG [Ferrimicrobium acidiphilum]|jgi:flagellar motor switch protein FliG|uniref:Flagellar motor switch protein FliG n=1 Tax=Ferrimicrobium acidiphilum DSM 19497 TaxID=1121877 RepID=A0A0D8FTH2_9ACTN|nr:flagellar motor switch protein FliG [Ferrimicrobium acidiphilum]KJE76583.1 flagellar motor switch protein FliG [Ferrimicrobium acidiphilum DSM 19497]